MQTLTNKPETKQIAKNNSSRFELNLKGFEEFEKYLVSYFYEDKKARLTDESYKQDTTYVFSIVQF